ncbi:hypothetical protein OUZ56_008224 [Daphnia magna]|uniref:Uncharacterized protein n=1 Tax=Daphnia magna TaxID=35525 RepID=A0ABR0ACC5_9CRUS|nr:hypothetical protein OUZ56_008224 [Daphnia magna]
MIEPPQNCLRISRKTIVQLNENNSAQVASKNCGDGVLTISVLQQMMIDVGSLSTQWMRRAGRWAAQI